MACFVTHHEPSVQPMCSSLFEASKLKISRASRHIIELRNAATALQDKTPFVAIIQGNALVVRVREKIPDEFSAIIGDAIHNLRAALDLLACEAVRLNGGNDKDVYFPFAGTAQELDLMIRKRKIDRAGVAVVELVRSLKPYVSGNNPLRAIHDLDIDDKHKKLILTAQVAKIDHLQYGNLTMLNGTFPGRDGQIILLGGGPIGPMGLEFPLNFALTFPQNSPFPSEEVIPTLESLTQLTLDIVHAFAKLFILEREELPGGQPG